jgi:hypothetical protein
MSKEPISLGRNDYGDEPLVSKDGDKLRLNEDSDYGEHYGNIIYLDRAQFEKLLDFADTLWPDLITKRMTDAITRRPK